MHGAMVMRVSWGMETDSRSKPELVNTLAGKSITRYSILSVSCTHGVMALRVSWVMETWTLGLNQN